MDPSMEQSAPPALPVGRVVWAWQWLRLQGGSQRRVSEAGCPTSSSPWGFSKHCRWACRHQVHHLLLLRSFPWCWHCHIAWYLSRSSEAPRACPCTSVSILRCLIQLQELRPLIGMVSHIMFWQYTWNHACRWVCAFEQLQGRPEGRRWHPCHPGTKAWQQPCPCCRWTRHRRDCTCQCQCSTTGPVPCLQQFRLMGKAPSPPAENHPPTVQHHSRHDACSTPQSGA